MQNKYLKLFIIILAVAVVVPQVALAAWWNPMSWNWGRLNSIFHFQQTAQKQTACTMEAKICPDGSSVGRHGPKCEFDACPVANNYFEIKEAGIKFKVTDAIKDLTYKFSTENNGFIKYVAFTTTSLLAKDSACGSSSIGTLEITSNKPDEATPRNSANLVLKTGSSTYYYYYRPQSVCATSQTNTEAIQLQGAQTSALQIALKTIELFNPLVDKEKTCINSGGSISITACYCSDTKDFYNACAIGGCTCTPDPKNKRNIETCNCGQGKCWDGEKCVNPKESLDRPVKTQPIVGGDRDAHGCIGSAGYTWCAAKNKCSRSWEEKCQ